MSELSFRVAKFLKMMSMFLVLGSLLYFYAYVDDRLDAIIPASGGWFSEISKSVVFYTGLGIFAVFNLVINAVLSVFKGTNRYDQRSLIFKSEVHKEQIWLWLLYLTAAVNVLISSIITYIALLRMNQAEGTADYAFVPGFGFLVTLVALAGILVSIFKKS